MTEEQAWLALNAAEVAPRRALELVERFGSPTALMSASLSSVASAVRVPDGELARLGAAREGDYEAMLERMRELGIRLVTIRDGEYPANLREISDPPPVLFVRGKLLAADQRSVAIVGTRRVTPYGKRVTEVLARGLAQRGVTVVSGLAVGADAAAHGGALAGGGRTIGVLACGIDVTYPKGTMELREQMVERGAVIAEAPLGTPAERHRFRARNRLISGLAMGVVVTEAPERSGALITANLAADQGRQVFAVPGSVDSEFSRGTHALLRDGARLVESVEDVFDELNLPELRRSDDGKQETPKEPARADLSGEENAILEALSLQQKHVDDIISDCRLPSGQASAGLLMLELKGLVRRLPGSMFMRLR